MEKKSENQSIQEKADQLVRYYQVNSILKKEDALNIIFSKIEKGEKSVEQPKSIARWILITSVAASIALAITIYVFTATTSFVGASGETASLRLPDNSRVILHGESTMKHRKYFWNRKVQLQGDAYFEVQKGSRFVVKTKKGSVEVLGTRFQVAETRETMLVKCFEGKVKTRIADESFILTAGMQVSENENIGITHEFHQEPFPQFAVFNKSYSNAEIAMVVKDIEQFFGISINAKNVATRTFSGYFENGTLDGAMEILTRSLHLTYQSNGENRYIIIKN